MSYYTKRLKCDDMNLMNEIADIFITGNSRKTAWGNFKIEGDRLVYKTSELEEVNGPKDNEKVIDALRNLKDGLCEFSPDSYGPKTYDEFKAKLKEATYLRFKVRWAVEDVIAMRINKDLIVGNSSVLSLVGRTVAYGNEQKNRDQTVIQRVLSNKIPMIPFTVFEQAKLDLKKMNMLDRGEDETVRIKTVRKEWNNKLNKNVDKISWDTRHFTGASLFEVDGKVFLFDIDRNEIKHGIFNPFLVELKSIAKTIEAAYEILKPQAVKDAIAKGLEVKRQGEWFFIPCKAPKLPKLSKIQKLQLLAARNINATGFRSTFSHILKWDLRGSIGFLGQDFAAFNLKTGANLAQKIPKQINLRAGNNRPNSVEIGMQIKGLTYALGKVSHSGREHKDLKLKSWHIAVPNTSVRSFTITGDVD